MFPIYIFIDIYSIKSKSTPTCVSHMHSKTYVSRYLNFILNKTWYYKDLCITHLPKNKLKENFIRKINCKTLRFKSFCTPITFMILNTRKIILKTIRFQIKDID